MVRQVISVLAILCLLCACGTVAQAASYTAYDGNPSNTYITYYRDILAGVPVTDNYVVFRSNQYEYIMVTGDIVYNNGLFTSETELEGKITAKTVVVEENSDFIIVTPATSTTTGTTYTITTGGSYNASYSFNIGTISSLVLDAGDEIVYSDLGTYPQLEERGAKYEILTTILIVAICVGYVCKSVFHYRPR